MPHLGRSGLNESALLKMVGHDRWKVFANASGVATDKIADAFENRLYATFCFVELLLPPDRPLSAYDENDCLRFSRDLTHYGRIYLDGYYKLKNGGPFSVRCTNVFIYQLAGPQQLKMAQPENCDFTNIPELASQPDSLNLCRAAKAEGRFQAPMANPGNLGTRASRLSARSRPRCQWRGPDLLREFCLLPRLRRTRSAERSRSSGRPDRRAIDLLEADRILRQRHVRRSPGNFHHRGSRDL